MTGISRGNPVESIHDYYCFDCQAGRFDPVDSTAFVNVGCTLLYGEIPPSLVTGNRAICVNISDIVISVGSFFFFLFFFFNQELDLCVSIACLPLLTFQSFPTVTGYLSHCLVCGIPEGKKRTPLFHPPQTCFNPNCCLLCYLNLHRRK